MDKINISQFALPEAAQPIYRDANGVSYSIYKAVSVSEIIDGVQWVVNAILIGGPAFISYPLKEIMKNFGIIKIFTNIDVDTLPAETVYQIYDTLTVNGIFADVANFANGEQIDFYKKSVDETVKSIIEYKNSAAGIIDTLSANAKESTEAMQDNLAFLQDEKSLTQVKALLNQAKQMGMPIE